MRVDVGGIKYGDKITMGPGIHMFAPWQQSIGFGFA